MPKGIKGFQKGHTIWVGKKCSEKTKIKLSLARKKWLETHESPLLGKIAWNKGLKGIQHHSIEVRKKISQHSFRKGKFGNRSMGWRGGRIKDSRGYILIYKPEHPFAKNVYVQEHRLVIEKIIGRYLLSKEEVHHLNERDNNKPQMLMAFASKSAHQRFEHNGIVKSEEIIFDGRNLKNG